MNKIVETISHQALMDEVYKKWRNIKIDDDSVTRDMVVNKYFTKLHQAACVLGNMNYQVNNGGFMQWYDNGYLLEDYDSIIKYCDRAVSQGIRGFDKVKEILTDMGDCKEVELHSTYWEDCNCGGDENCEDCAGLGEYEMDYENDIFKDEYNQKFSRIRKFEASMQEFLNRFDEVV